MDILMRINQWLWPQSYATAIKTFPERDPRRRSRGCSKTRATATGTGIECLHRRAIIATGRVQRLCRPDKLDHSGRPLDVVTTLLERHKQMQKLKQSFQQRHRSCANDAELSDVLGSDQDGCREPLFAEYESLAMLQRKDEHNLLDFIDQGSATIDLSTMTGTALRAAAESRVALRRQKKARRKLKADLQLTRKRARQALHDAGLVHFELQVQELKSRLLTLTLCGEETERQLRTSLVAFYTSVAMDIDSTSTDVVKFLEWDTKDMDDNILRVDTDGDRRKLYEEVKYRLREARHRHDTFGESYSREAQERLDQVQAIEGELSDKRVDALLDAHAVEWIRRWSAHIKHLGELEDTFMFRRRYAADRGILDSRLPGGHLGSLLGSKDPESLVLDSMGEGWDIPAYGGEHPEDGSVGSLSPSNIERLQNQKCYLQEAIETWMRRMDDLEPGSDSRDSAYLNAEQNLELELAPQHTPSQVEYQPRLKRKLKGYQAEMEHIVY